MAGQDFDGYAIDIIYMPLSFRCGCDYTMLTTDTAVSPGKPQFFLFMTRPVKCIVRLAADTGRPVAEGGAASSVLS